VTADADVAGTVAAMPTLRDAAPTDSDTEGFRTPVLQDLTVTGPKGTTGQRLGWWVPRSQTWMAVGEVDGRVGFGGSST
jgi:hypothetical protein